MVTIYLPKVTLSPYKLFYKHTTFCRLFFLITRRVTQVIRSKSKACPSHYFLTKSNQVRSFFTQDCSLNQQYLANNVFPQFF